jgi:DNA primase
VIAWVLWDTSSSSLIREPPAMPGIDFAAIRSRIRMAQVLELAGFVVVGCTGDQVRGPCPIHRSGSPTSRSFSANLSRNTFRCFRCGAAGNQLDLWVAVSQLSLHEAATDLCNRLAMETPFLPRAQPAGDSYPRPTEKRNP